MRGGRAARLAIGADNPPRTVGTVVPRPSTMQTGAWLIQNNARFEYTTVLDGVGHRRPCCDARVFALPCSVRRRVSTNGESSQTSYQEALASTRYQCHFNYAETEEYSSAIYCNPGHFTYLRLSK